MKLQKAVDLTNLNQLHNKDVWVSGKYDGVRAWREAQTLLSTRGGKELAGFHKLNAELDTLMADHGIPFVDGEMDAPLMTFQDVQGVVLSGQPSFLKDEIKLYVFAIGGAFKNTQAMIEKMHSVFSGCAHIVPVDYRLISKADIDIHYKEALAHGFEGLMLRQPYGHYDQGGLFRLKPVKEADFIITGYYEGRGANVGRLGGFVCEGEVDGKPIRVRVGGGFKVEEREEFWAMGTQCIGLTLEVIYKYVTDKPDKDGFYSLREPRANKMKLDR